MEKRKLSDAAHVYYYFLCNCAGASVNPCLFRWDSMKQKEITYMQNGSEKPEPS